MSLNGQSNAVPHASHLKHSGFDYVGGVFGAYAAFGLSLALTALLARVLGAEGYGRLALLIAAAQTAVFFASFWTTAGLVRFGSEALVAEGSLLRVFWARNFIIAMPLILLAAGLLTSDGKLLAWFGISAEDKLPVSAYLISLAVFQTSQFAYQAVKQVRHFALWQVAEKVLLIASVWVVITWFTQRTAALLLCYAAASGLVGFASLAGLGSKHWFPIRTDRAVIGRLMRFSWPLLLSLVCGYLSTNWIDLLIIRHYESLASVGHYNLAYQIMGTVQTLPTASFPVVLPLLVTWQVQGYTQGLPVYLSRLVPHAYVVLAGLLVGVLALIRWLIPLAFGAEFASAIVPCGWLLLAVACYGLFISMMAVLNLWEDTKTVLLASVAAGIVNITGDWVLVPVFGITGAAIATLCAYATSAAIVTWAVARRQPVPVFSLLPAMAAVALACLGSMTARYPAVSVGAFSAAVGLLGWTIRREGLFGHREWRLLFEQYAAGTHAAAAALQRKENDPASHAVEEATGVI